MSKELKHVLDLFDIPFKMFNTVDLSQPARHPANLYEDDNNYFIEIAATGMSEEHITVTEHRKHDYLVIQVIGEVECDDKDFIYHQRKICKSAFDVSYVLPDDANGDDVECSLERGLLTIRIGRMVQKEQEYKTNIPVKVLD